MLKRVNIIIFISILSLMILVNSSYLFAENEQSENENQTNTLLVTPDVLLLSAILAEQKSLVLLNIELEELETNLINLGLDAIIKRWQSYHLDDKNLRQALIDLMIDFAVLKRFDNPEIEFFLAFDKSVVLRLNSFYRLLSSQSFKSSSVFGLPYQQSNAQLKRLYQATYPLDMSTAKGRLKALIWLHILRTEPQLKKIFDQINLITKVIYLQSNQPFDEIANLAYGLTFSQMKDFSDTESIETFATRFEKLDDFKKQMLKNISILPQINSHFLPSLKKLDADNTSINAALLLAITSNDFTKELDSLAGFRLPFDVARAMFLMRAKNSPAAFQTLLFTKPLIKHKNLALALWSQTQATVHETTQNTETMFDIPAESYLELSKDIYLHAANYYDERAKLFLKLADNFDEAVEVHNLCKGLARQFESLASISVKENATSQKFVLLPDYLVQNPDLKFAYQTKTFKKKLLQLFSAAKNASAYVFVASAKWQNEQVSMAIKKEDSTSDDLSKSDGDIEQETAKQNEMTRIIKLTAYRLQYTEGSILLGNDGWLEHKQMHGELINPAYLKNLVKGKTTSKEKSSND